MSRSTAQSTPGRLNEIRELLVTLTGDENVMTRSIVRAALDALDAGDLEAVVDILDPAPFPD